MPQEPDIPSNTSVLLIDSSANHRTYWADQLKRWSADYEILEVSDGQSGLDLCRSRRIDCVVIEIELPDQSGWRTLVDLIPLASKPRIAVIVLANLTYPGVWNLAKQNGACACFVKKHTSGEDLDRAIQRAIASVGQVPKEDRYRPI